MFDLINDVIKQLQKQNEKRRSFNFYLKHFFFPDSLIIKGFERAVKLIL